MKPVKKVFLSFIKNSSDQRIKNIIPSDSFLKEFEDYLNTLKNIEY
jgi:hypothetical protein